MRRSRRRYTGIVGMVLTLALASPGVAHSNTPKQDSDFGWDLVSTGSRIAGVVIGDQELEKLKKRYDGIFFFFHDETGRYLVTDSDLVPEAMRASREMEKHHDLIQTVANAEAKLALSSTDPRDEIERLERKMQRLEDEIEEMEREGESTERLERKRFQVSVSLQAVRSLATQTQLTETQKKELIRDRDAAKTKLREVERAIDGKVRQVAETAKRKGMAERLP